MDKYAKMSLMKYLFMAIEKGEFEKKTTEDEDNIMGGLRWGLTWGLTWGVTWGLENVKSLTMNGLS